MRPAGRTYLGVKVSYGPGGGTQSVTKLFLKFSGPGIISMVVATSYNVVDAAYVGRLGPDALLPSSQDGSVRQIMKA